MEQPNADYLKGYEEAYREIYATIESEDHPRICGGACRPCGVVRTALETSLMEIGRMMTQEEFWAFTGIIAQVNRRKLET